MNIEFPNKIYIPNIFVVKAYRFTTDNKYFVGIVLTRNEAEKLAENEVLSRGGKYSCAIYECEINSTELINTILSPHHKNFITEFKP